MQTCKRFLATLIALLGSLSASAAEDRFGAFVGGDAPHILVLDGEIASTTALDFRRALKARPSTKLLLLDSPGGLVDMALLVAYQIRERGISTIVPAAAGCYSACVYLYLAGVQRRADGELGVHQLYNDSNDLSAGQVVLSDVLEALEEFGAPIDLVSRMLRTPAGSIYVFSRAEIASLGLNTGNPNSSGAATGSLTVVHTPPPEYVVRDLGPENLTVVPKTRTSHRDVQAEKFIRIDGAAAMPDVLLRHGFTAQTATMVTVALKNSLPAMTLPPGTWLRVLFGPSRATETLIPYRLTIYLPRADGSPWHAATAALTDRGSYVLGLAPEPAVVGDLVLGEHIESKVPVDTTGGKQDRLSRQMGM